MGTPDIAATCLKKIIADGFEVVGVYTQPDRPKGRGMKMVFSPVKEVAIAHNIPVFQPENFREAAIAWWTGKKQTPIDTYWNEFLAKFWPQVPELPDTRAIMAYRVLDELLMTGKLEQEIVEVKGLLTSDRCSHTVFNWKD